MGRVWIVRATSGSGSGPGVAGHGGKVDWGGGGKRKTLGQASRVPSLVRSVISVAVGT